MQEELQKIRQVPIRAFYTMSFDMYLFGEIDHSGQNPGDLFMETYNLAFWQKHYRLHEFIIHRFGWLEATEESEHLYLSKNDIRMIIDDIRAGMMDYENKNNYGLNKYDEKFDIEQFEFALKWLLGEQGLERSVRYAFA